MSDVVRKVLFVCSGNTCRSPMAERLLRARAQAAGLSLEVASAGLRASEGAPASPRAREALRRRQLEADDHQSRRLTVELLEEADLILTMTQKQKCEILRRWPLAAGKVHVLAQFAEPECWQQPQLAGMDVPDPYGGDDAEYERCVARLNELVEGVLRRLYPAAAELREG